MVASLLPIVTTTGSGRVLMRERAAQYQAGKTRPLMRQVLNEFDEQPSGLWLPPDKVLKRFDSARIGRVLWKIVRGLYYVHHASVLPESTPRRFLSVRADEEMPAFAVVLEGSENRGEVPSVFDYRFTQIIDVEGMHLWALRLWQYFTIFVAHHAPNIDERARS